MKKKKRYKTESNRYYTCVYNQGGNGEGFKGLEALKLDTLGRYMTFQNFAVRKVDRPKVRSIFLASQIRQMQVVVSPGCID